MITINNTEYRNLEEQVLKNKQDIAKHYQATQLPLNLAGIEVIGSITNPSELNGVVGEKFGDAYVQVVGEDTLLWIWTRANPDAGEDDSYWLDIPFTTVGEQGAPGATGPQGPQGIRGSKWFTSKTQVPPSPGSQYIDGDMWVSAITGSSAAGTVWRYNDPIGWTQYGSIRGPQGATGPAGQTGPQGKQGERGAQGPQGPAGKSVRVAGIVSEEDQLPDPVDLNDTSLAYLVGEPGSYQLYIQLGRTPATAMWDTAGPFNAGTVVYANGSTVETWDADTKLDNITYTPTFNAVPTIQANSRTQSWARLQYSASPGSNPGYSIPQRNEYGCIQVANPGNDYDAVNYVTLSEKVSRLIGKRIYIRVDDDTSGDNEIGTYIYSCILPNDTLITDDRELIINFLYFLIDTPIFNHTLGQDPLIIKDVIGETDDGWYEIEAQSRTAPTFTQTLYIHPDYIIEETNYIYDP